ncbi:hypothetical protein H634G_03571 [Metarhizium anisopliae BRIP 53293]|uniref:DUF1168 domain protein n=1 Tax=Metarhizium anisopliae BRIP 53293 TaxID=1291518 RepID=A0A0D9P4J3_METAN|nr:hypothetical protein H634G_03571 [Metarhizium anisopliae BRIP 53293]KJK86752.1 hypothetical protein H633G_09409 [Metarhizium anisopliae BRIP 53284]
MSAPGPESIPTSADPRSRRATKKRVLSPTSSQAASLTALFAKPDQNIPLPSSAAVKRAPHIPEIYTNVQGSSAGAGSGEFHVYKASRRREYQRLREMDETLKREKDQDDFEKSRAERLQRDEEKTRKNRERREKMKARKANKGKKAGGTGAGGGEGIQDAAQGPSRHGGDPGVQEDRGEQDKTAGGAASLAPVGLVIHDDD